MKLTDENYKDYVPKKDQELFGSLLIDLSTLNSILVDQGEAYRKLYFDIETNHTPYSPERTDPCPDYYGMYTIRFEKNKYETVGDYMTINELDNAMLIISNFVESKLS